MPDLADQSQSRQVMDFHKVFSSLRVDASIKRQDFPSEDHVQVVQPNTASQH